jgi:hypothetical protein
MVVGRRYDCCICRGACPNDFPPVCQPLLDALWKLLLLFAEKRRQQRLLRRGRSGGQNLQTVRSPIHEPFLPQPLELEPVLHVPLIEDQNALPVAISTGLPLSPPVPSSPTSIVPTLPSPLSGWPSEGAPILPDLRSSLVWDPLLLNAFD